MINDEPRWTKPRCYKTYSQAAPGYIDTIYGVHKEYVFCNVRGNFKMEYGANCNRRVNAQYWYTILKRVPDSANPQNTTNYKYIQTITDEHWYGQNISFYGEWMVTHSFNNEPLYGATHCPCEESYTTYYYNIGGSSELNDLELSGWAVDENDTNYWSENCQETKLTKKYKKGNLNFFKLNSATEKWDLHQTIEVDFLNKSSSKPIMKGDTVVLGCTSKFRRNNKNIMMLHVVVFMSLKEVEILGHYQKLYLKLSMEYH